MAKRREKRNSTAEFLIFQIEGMEQGVITMCQTPREFKLPELEKWIGIVPRIVFIN